jgi:cyclase
MVLDSPLCKRIIPCLDVDNGRTVKGTKFQNLRDMGDPVEMGAEYERQGADELMFLDITASHEERKTMLAIVQAVADRLSIPFTVGGGIASIDDVKRLLDGGADKVSINTAAVNNPRLVDEIAKQCGSQCCVVAIDARKQGDSWVVLTRGGRVDTGLDAWQWAKQVVELGAGEILLTSWDRDGTLSGFDLELTEHFSRLPVPVIASGGAHSPQSFVDVFTNAGADAALAASIFHDGTWTVSALKAQIAKAGITVRI